MVFYFFVCRANFEAAGPARPASEQDFRSRVSHVGFGRRGFGVFIIIKNQWTLMGRLRTLQQLTVCCRVGPGV